MMHHKAVRVCVVGCGHWGKNLVRNFNDIGCLYAVADTNSDLLKRVTEPYAAAKSFASLENALNDPNVDAVAIATPAEQHYTMGLRALQAGKSVFVEKPLALDVEHGLAMASEATKRGTVLMVGHLLRYHPAIIKIQELIENGSLGRIDYIYSNRLSMGKIRREENALWSFAPHDISIILALVGELPLEVTVTGGAYLQPNVADVTVSNLLFNRGTRAHIFVSWLHPYKEQRLVVLGSDKMVLFEDTRSDNKLVLFDKNIVLKNGAYEAAKPQGTPVSFDAGEPLQLECSHFVECVREKREPWTSAQEGIRVLQVLQACQRSLQLNGQPVQVGELRRLIPAI